VEHRTIPGPSTGTADVSVARLVLAGLTEEGLLRSPARATEPPEPGIPDESGRVPSGYLTGLWRRGLDEADDPALGMRTASHWQLGRLRLADYLFATSATVGEAIATTARYAPLMNTADREIRLSGRPDEAETVTYQIRSRDPEVDAQASQFALAVVLSRVRHAAGTEVRPLSLVLASEPPPHHQELAAWFGARRIEFGAERSTMTVAPADLSLALPGADATLAAVLRRHAAEVMAAQATTAAAQVRRVVVDQLAGAGPSLTAAARRLTLSPRSLQRRLAEEGTTWRDLVDDVRRERAAVLLGKGLSRTAAATRLGFSDARALRAALQRWRD